MFGQGHALTQVAIDQFSNFLSNLSRAQAATESAGQLKILKKYCDEQSSETHEQVDFPDLLSTWQNASQANDETVLAAISSALALFFRTISTHVEFREFGLSLCHSLLKRDQLRIFDRALSSPKSKDHIISSALQLLTEIASFDGGALATNVFARRDLLYRRLDGILIQSTPSTPTNGQYLTAHEATLTFILANLKYLDPVSKTELITHGRVLASFIRGLPNAQPNIVIEALQTLGKSVLDDRGLSKQTKTRCFNSGNLSALAKLYDHDTESEQTEEAGNSTSVRDALHRLLLQACTTSIGVLQQQSGWYPAGMNPEVLERDENSISLGLDSPYQFDDYREKVPIKNGTLSVFIQGLKPESDIQQAGLVNSIFAAAPELIADYFSKKSKLVVAPGDDPMWRGQFAFLFSVVQQPAPNNCGWHEKLPPMPPPLSIVIESILPRPLDRATISKCLRMKDDIMTMSFARFLTIAFEKLDAVLSMFEAATSGTGLWSQASSQLVSLFVDRIPQIQDVITALQTLGEKDGQVRTAVLECIATYHKVLPSITTTSKFDIGAALGKTLHTLGSDSEPAESHDILLDQLLHLVQIAAVSSATKWFHKSASDEVSLIIQLLKYCVEHPETTVTQQAFPIFKTLLNSKGILDPRTRSLEALLSSLEATKKWAPEGATYRFLDNCMTRTMQRPVMYLDQAEQMQQLVSDSKSLSLLACCVAEQWSFVTKREDKQGVKNIAGWVSRLFSTLDAAGENYRVMTQLKEEMMSAAKGDEKGKAALEKAFDKQRKKAITLVAESPVQEEEESKAEEGDEESSGKIPIHLSQQRPELDLSSVFDPLPPIPSSLSGLDRWTKPDFESEIQSGRLVNLIRCLISPEAEVHLQAFHTLQGDVMHAVEQSAYAEKTQLYLLLGELCETVREHHARVAEEQRTSSSSSSSPLLLLPSIVAELAIHALPTIADPSSPFYLKLNRFLLRSPSWALGHRLLQDQLGSAFLQEPSADDSETPDGRSNAQRLEIEHLLDLLCRSLRTEHDMDLFRRAHVFPRLFAYFSTAVCSADARRKILTVVLRATAVPGGSDTLVTRAGVREWLAIVRRLRGHGGQGPLRFGNVDPQLTGWIDAVAGQVERTCDAARIERWEREAPMYRLREQNVAATTRREQKEPEPEPEPDLDADEEDETDRDSESESDSSSESGSESEEESSSEDEE